MNYIELTIRNNDPEELEYKILINTDDIVCIEEIFKGCALHLRKQVTAIIVNETLEEIKKKLNKNPFSFGRDIVYEPAQ